ncbi:MAG: hypothetical protein ACI96M_004111, partial [Candidatus Azotimanducaceae bacterium]
MKSTAEILARIDQLTQNTSRSLAQLS